MEAMTESSSAICPMSSPARACSVSFAAVTVSRVTFGVCLSCSLS